MNVRKPIWTYLTRAVLFLLLVATAMLIGVSYWPHIRDNESLRKQLLLVEEEVRLEKARIQQKEALLSTLSDDPKAIERLAREKLGLAKPGEMVVVFVAGATNPPVPPASTNP